MNPEYEKQQIGEIAARVLRYLSEREQYLRSLLTEEEWAVLRQWHRESRPEVRAEYAVLYGDRARLLLWGPKKARERLRSQVGPKTWRCVVGVAYAAAQHYQTRILLIYASLTRGQPSEERLASAVCRAIDANDSVPFPWVRDCWDS